jgi:protein ImuA
MTPYLPLFDDLPLLGRVSCADAPGDSLPMPESLPARGDSADPLPTIDRLARQIRDLQTIARPDGESIPSGCGSMDRLLPTGGYGPGSMVELIRSGATGTGVCSLALMIAKNAMKDGKFLIVVDTQKQFYPPAVQSLGIPIERVIAIQPTNHADIVWGMDQALRCPAVGAVIADVGSLEDRIARRLQLATEQGGGLGILVRDASSARSQPSWADVQWQVRSYAPNLQNQFALVEDRLDTRWFELELTRCNRGRTGARLILGIDANGRWTELPTKIEARHEQASAMHLAAQLAQPTRRRRDIAG